jgi:hypothetical protein
MRLIDADALYDTFERTPWMDNADRDIAEEVAENAPNVSHWVKTADRLPDDDEPVLVTYVGYIDNLPHNDAIAVYAHEITDNYAGAWYWQDSDGVDDNPVRVSITHWMPFPPLPEAEV